MDNLMLILGWGSPIGIGIFLLCIAGMIFILTKAQKAKGKKDQVELVTFKLSMTIEGGIRRRASVADIFILIIEPK